MPAAGQAWTFPAFAATVQDGRIYGRGSCDMKGFIALAIDAMLDAADHRLNRPLQLALSHYEEIGRVGVRRLLDALHLAPARRPFLCVIGEPTNMQFVLGDKGKCSYRTYCRGQEAHLSLAPRSVNAIHVACDFIAALAHSQQQLQRHGAQDSDYDVPYSTVHVGQIVGGKALNIVPNLCTLDFEVRNLPADDLDLFLEQMRERAEVIVREAQKLSSVAAIEIETVNVYPGLDTHPSVEAVRFSSNSPRQVPALPRSRSVPRAACSSSAWMCRWWCAGRVRSSRRTSPTSLSRSAKWTPASAFCKVCWVRLRPSRACRPGGNFSTGRC